MALSSKRTGYGNPWVAGAMKGFSRFTENLRNERERQKKMQDRLAEMTYGQQLKNIDRDNEQQLRETERAAQNEDQIVDERRQISQRGVLAGYDVGRTSGEETLRQAGLDPTRSGGVISNAMQVAADKKLAEINNATDPVQAYNELLSWLDNDVGKALQLKDNPQWIATQRILVGEMATEHEKKKREANELGQAVKTDKALVNMRTALGETMPGEDPVARRLRIREAGKGAEGSPGFTAIDTDLRREVADAQEQSSRENEGGELSATVKAFLAERSRLQGESRANPQLQYDELTPEGLLQMALDFGLTPAEIDRMKLRATTVAPSRAFPTVPVSGASPSGAGATPAMAAPGAAAAGPPATTSQDALVQQVMGAQGGPSEGPLPSPRGIPSARETQQMQQQQLLRSGAGLSIGMGPPKSGSSGIAVGQGPPLASPIIVPLKYVQGFGGNLPMDPEDIKAIQDYAAQWGITDFEEAKRRLDAEMATRPVIP